MAGIRGQRLAATQVVADTDTLLYACDVAETEMTDLVICNTGSVSHTFRLAHIEGAIGTVSLEDYLEYDSTIEANTTYIWPRSLYMLEDDTVMVRADHADVVFSARGLRSE